MFYKQTPVKITRYGLAAGCQVFYRKIYGCFFFTIYSTFKYGSLSLVVWVNVHVIQVSTKEATKIILFDKIKKKIWRRTHTPKFKDNHPKGHMTSYSCRTDFYYIDVDASPFRRHAPTGNAFHLIPNIVLLLSKRRSLDLPRDCRQKAIIKVIIIRAEPTIIV